METVTHSDFEISVFQATIFTPDEDLSAAKVMKELYPKWSEMFDADPEVRPSLPAVPAEFPRVILRNKSNVLSLEIAAGRANFFVRKTKKDQPPITLNDSYKAAIPVLSECHRLIGCRVGRLAAVVTRFAKHENPGFFLASHFCKEKWNEAPLNRPENFELHAFKCFRLVGELRVNSWVRSKTGFFEAKNEKLPVVLVEQDINTLAEESATCGFNVEEIDDFLQKVIPEFDLILSLYYHGDKEA